MIRNFIDAYEPHIERSQKSWICFPPGPKSRPIRTPAGIFAKNAPGYRPYNDTELDILRQALEDDNKQREQPASKRPATTPKGSPQTPRPNEPEATSPRTRPPPSDRPSPSSSSAKAPLPQPTPKSPPPTPRSKKSKATLQSKPPPPVRPIAAKATPPQPASSSSAADRATPPQPASSGSAAARATPPHFNYSSEEIEQLEKFLRAGAPPLAPHLKIKGAQEKAYADGSCLVEKKVYGDGNCLFRAVAALVFRDELQYQRVRDDVLADVRANRQFYKDRSGASETLDEWIAEMSKSGAWGDHIALVAIAIVFERPILVWRKYSPDRAPDPFPAGDLHASRTAPPLYLLLDESTPGVEHYNALVLAGDEIAALPAVGQGPSVQKRGKEAARVSVEGHTRGERPVGFRNNGHTSYVNSAIQALLGSGHVRKYLQSEQYDETALYHILALTLSENPETPDKILLFHTDRVGGAKEAHFQQIFPDNEENDASEYLNNVLRWFKDLFAWPIRILSVCDTCNRTISDGTLEHILDFRLPGDVNTVHTSQTLLDMYFSGEPNPKKKCCEVMCNKMTFHTDFKYVNGSPPECLKLSIRQGLVKFNPVLYIAQHFYELRSVGYFRSGHSITVALGQSANGMDKWWEFDDSQVRKLSTPPTGTTHGDYVARFAIYDRMDVAVKQAYSKTIRHQAWKSVLR